MVDVVALFNFDRLTGVIGIEVSDQLWVKGTFGGNSRRWRIGVVVVSVPSVVPSLASLIDYAWKLLAEEGGKHNILQPSTILFRGSERWNPDAFLPWWTHRVLPTVARGLSHGCLPVAAVEDLLLLKVLARVDFC